MAIPQPPQARTAQRSVSEYTVGNPDTRPDLSTAATSPTISTLTTNPPIVQTVGIDSQTAVIGVGSLSAGTSTTITVTIPLPGLPANLDFGVNDRVLLTPTLSISNPIAGLVIGSFFAVPQAFGGRRYIQGPLISNNVSYGAYNVLVTVTFVAVTATAAGNVTLRVEGVLWDTPG